MRILIATLRAPILCAVLAFLLIGPGVAATPAGAPTQPLETIVDAARAFAAANGLRVGNRRSIEVAPLDARLRLAACASNLVASAAPGVRSNLRMTVEVRCPAPGGWRLFVPVKIKTFDNAVVATRALPRGHVLTPNDVTALESDVSALPAGYASDPAQLVGRRVVRPLVAGAVIGGTTLAIEPAVARGQTVTLFAQARGLAVRMQGVALATGAIDQRIKIRNLSSGREVEGVVRSAGLVEIALP